jgi:glutathione synthase/RimK-type ligase-like ATP-grasp enzyme
MPQAVSIRGVMRVALVTCARLGGLDPDDQPLAEALQRLGAAAEAPVWDDPGVDWGGYDVVFLRSTWDYHLSRDRFLAWLESIEPRTRLVHGPGIVRWNSHKSYLSRLAVLGAPVIPTVVLHAGRRESLQGLLQDRGWDDAVAKPAVGLDSFGVLRLAAGDLQAEETALRLLAERDLLVQPYVPSVADHGERCLVVLDGHLSHAIRKNSFFMGGRHVGPEGRAVPIADDERRTAELVLEAAKSDLEAGGVTSRIRYARVDLARDAQGQPRLMELELVEPTLFFTTCPGSADLMARSLVQGLA